jgi:hypothetical protein
VESPPAQLSSPRGRHNEHINPQLSEWGDGDSLEVDEAASDRADVLDRMSSATATATEEVFALAGSGRDGYRTEKPASTGSETPVMYLA